MIGKRSLDALSDAAGHAIAACRRDCAAHDRPTGTQKPVIRHIVFFTVPERGNLEAVIEGLSLLTGIPHARRLEIGTNIRADRFDGRIDVVVHGEFDDEQALAAYHAHPLYQQSIDRVRPLRGERYAVDYVVEDAVAQDLTLSPTKSAV